jgi:hypothetical protein
MIHEGGLMKKKTKRLNLSRETLAGLRNDQIEVAVGGASQKPIICCGMSGSCPPPPSAGDTSC